MSSERRRAARGPSKREMPIRRRHVASRSRRLIASPPRHRLRLRMVHDSVVTANGQAAVDLTAVTVRSVRTAIEALEAYRSAPPEAA